MGWEMRSLGDVCKIVGGGTPPKSNEEYFSGSIPWATVRDMKKELLDTTEFKITEEAVKKSSTNVIPKGEVIIASRVGLGKVCVLQQETAINQDLKAIIPKNDSLNRSFLLQWLKSKAEYIENEGTGATVKGVKITFLKGLQIPVPPLKEQKKIVAILDQAFAEIDKARANAEQNLKNARELFDSYLNQVFSQRGEGWETEALENVVKEDCSLSYGIVQPGGEHVNGLPVVRPTDLTKEVVNLEGLKLIDPVKANGYSRTTLQGGELLVCVRGTTGTTSIACESLSGANVTRGIVPIRFDSKILFSRFAYFQFLSPIIQTQIKASTYGAALMQINIRDLRKIKVEIPPFEIQEKIANNLDKLLPALNKIESIYNKKLLKLDELKKSILQKAFSGELT